MSAQAVELARRFAYSLFRLRPWRMQSFEMVKMPLEKTGHPLERNLLPRFQRASDFAHAPDVVRFARWLAADRIDFVDLEN
jgi:hypothetical protein